MTEGSQDTRQRRSGRRRRAGRWLLVGFLAAYALTTAAHYIGGDHGIFAIIFAEGGHGHAPGYPLYSLYLRAMSWLPALSPAHGAALATVPLGAAAVYLLYRAAKAWGARSFAALVGALSFGLAAHVWFMHTQSEVFALNHLIAAAILWVAAPAGPLRGGRRTIVLALLAGLGIAHHHTVVLLTPVGLWAAVVGLRESSRPVRHGLMALGALAVGLSPYLYLVIVARWFPETWHWGEASTLEGFIDLFLRRDYGTLRVAPDGGEPEVLVQVGFLLEGLFEELLYVPALLGVAGMGKALVDLREGFDRKRVGFALLVVSAVLIGPGFVALLHRDPTGVNYLLIKKFHLLFYLMVALFAAFGLEMVRVLWDARWKRIVWLGALVGLGSVQALTLLSQHQGPQVEQYARDTLRYLEDDAILVGTGDHNEIGIQYVQRALGVRPDVQYVNANMLISAWYRKRLHTKLDTVLRTSGRESDSERLFDELLETGRPVYVTSALHPRWHRGFPSAPSATTIRIFAEWERPPDPVDVFDYNLGLVDGYEVEPTDQAPPESWAYEVLDTYARNWRTIGGAMEVLGEDERAQTADRIAERFEP